MSLGHTKHAIGQADDIGAVCDHEQILAGAASQAIQQIEHLLAGLFILAKDVARVEGVWESGYRLAFNVGDAAGMTIHHLHLHLLGGRMLGPEG